MNKLIRFFSMVVLAAGLVALTWYVFYGKESTGAEMLANPSYFVRQSFLAVFVSGGLVAAFALLSGFFAWNRKAEKKEEVLLNAGFVEKEQIHTWLENGGTVKETTASEDETEMSSAAGETERLSGGETEILPQSGETEILSADGETELLVPEDNDKKKEDQE